MDEHDANTYYGTKIVRSVKGSTNIEGSAIVHFDKWWEFDKGDLVSIRIRRLDGAGPEINITKKVTMVGNSKTIFLNRDLGFREGDVVVFAMTKVKGSDKGDDDESDARGGAEEED